MNALNLIQEVTRAGATMTLEGGDLVLSGARPLPDDLVEQLRRHKPEVVATLKNEPVDPEAYEERAAIMEYDGGLSREEAEAFAHAMQTRRMRERGEVPPHYTSTTICRHCGPVPIFEGVPDRVDGCPWCFNRVQGLPVPTKGTGEK